MLPKLLSVYDLPAIPPCPGAVTTSPADWGFQGRLMASNGRGSQTVQVPHGIIIFNSKLCFLLVAIGTINIATVSQLCGFCGIGNGPSGMAEGWRLGMYSSLWG